jgi:poly-gamma-glutamate capsule biosynthesis protein CapA/YwtB (metallophosphatase superfamily)
MSFHYRDLDLIDLSSVSNSRTHRQDRAETTLNFLGDWAPSSGRSDRRWAPDNNYTQLEFRYLLKHSLLNVFNLETPISKNPTGVLQRSKKIFLEPPSSLKFLQDHNLGLAALANNHTMDLGVEGLEHTLTSLRGCQIDSIGAGLDHDSIYRPYLFERQGTKIAIINVADGEAGGESLNDGVGVAEARSFRTIDQLRWAKGMGYFTIIFAHAGIEFLAYPAPFIQKQYRVFAEEGADLVIGHHPHVIQGMEVFSETPIFYSIGHFDIYRQAGRPGERLGLMLSLHFQGASLFRIELIPFQIFPKAIKLLDQRQLEIFKHGFNESCSRLGDARFLKTTWRAYVAARHPIVDFRRATSLYRRDSAQSAELLGSIFASGNMPYIMKEYQDLNDPTSELTDTPPLNQIDYARNLTLMEKFFIAQKDLFFFPTLAIRFLVNFCKRIRKYDR